VEERRHVRYDSLVYELSDKSTYRRIAVLILQVAGVDICLFLEAFLFSLIKGFNVVA
jgi:hypothetical protein